MEQLGQVGFTVKEPFYVEEVSRYKATTITESKIKPNTEELLLSHKRHKKQSLISQNLIRKK